MLKYTPEMIETEPKQIKEQLIERLAARSKVFEASDVALVLSGFNFEADLQNRYYEKKDQTLTHPTLTLTAALTPALTRCHEAGILVLVSDGGYMFAPPPPPTATPSSASSHDP